MAAGLGFKDFTTGEVLTAADVDGYLMQGIWVFASAAARDAAVTSPQEGNFAFLKDTNTTTYYTGSAWTNLDTTGMVNPMTTTGDTIYSSSGSTPARLGIGSTGQVLTVAGGVPSWATPTAGGMTLISTTSLSGASITLSSIPGTYKNLQLVVRNFLPSQDGYSLHIRINGDSTANRHYTTYLVGVSNASFNNNLWTTSAADKDTSNALFILDLYDYANTATWKIGRTFFAFNNETTATNVQLFQTMHAYNQTSAISSIEIRTDATSFSGTALLYGVS